MRYLASLSLLLTTSAQPVQERRPDWTWGRDGPGCTLRQVFAAGGRTIEISRTPGNDSTSIRIGGYNPMVPTRSTQSESLEGGRVSFEPGVQHDARIWVETDKERRDVSASSEGDLLPSLAQSAAVEISHPAFGKVRAPLRSTAEAEKALRGCEDSRMREWGIDPIAWRALNARPIPTKNWNEWLGPEDYPVAAIYAGLEGSIIARLDVGEDGVPKSCIPLNRNRPKGQRSPICEKLKRRARFKPALGTDGKPVPAPYVLIIRFRLA